MKTTQSPKLEAFRALVERDTRANFARKQARDQAEGLNYPMEIHEPDWTCTVLAGLKYAKVDVGRSGKYMVDLATGEIFGIKSYGVIHRGHRYGTLDTIHDFDWGGYQGHSNTCGDRMTGKTYNVVKQAVIDGRVIVAEDVTVKGGSIKAALSSIGARHPQPKGYLGQGISLFQDADGWNYLVNLNKP